MKKIFIGMFLGALLFAGALNAMFIIGHYQIQRCIDDSFPDVPTTVECINSVTETEQDILRALLYPSTEWTGR